MPNPWFQFIADYMKKNPKLNRKQAIIEITKKGLYKKCGESKTCAKKEKKLKPCKSNQFRNPETNRCKKKPLKPCPPGKKRNPKTNRCKKIVVKESAKPKPKPEPKPKAKPKECKDTHERDEDTGRCLKKCPPGKKRNKETKRCRKVKEDIEDLDIKQEVEEMANINTHYYKALYSGVASLLKEFDDTYEDYKDGPDYIDYSGLTDDEIKILNYLIDDKIMKRIVEYGDMYIDPITLRKYFDTLEKVLILNATISAAEIPILNANRKIFKAQWKDASGNIEEKLKDIEQQAPVTIEDITGKEEDEPYEVEEYVTEGEPLRPVEEPRKWEPEKVYESEEYDVSPEQIEELGKGDDSPQLLLEYIPDPDEEPYYEEDEPQETWEPPASVPDKPIWEEQPQEIQEYEIMTLPERITIPQEYKTQEVQEYEIMKIAKNIMPPQEYEILEEHIDNVDAKIEDIKEEIDYNKESANVILDAIKMAEDEELEQLENEINNIDEQIKQLEIELKEEEETANEILEQVVEEYPDMGEQLLTEYEPEFIEDEPKQDKDYDENLEYLDLMLDDIDELSKMGVYDNAKQWLDEEQQEDYDYIIGSIDDILAVIGEPNNILSGRTKVTNKQLEDYLYLANALIRYGELIRDKSGAKPKMDYSILAASDTESESEYDVSPEELEQLQKGDYGETLMLEFEPDPDEDPWEEFASDNPYDIIGEDEPEFVEEYEPEEEANY